MYTFILFFFHNLNLTLQLGMEEKVRALQTKYKMYDIKPVPVESTLLFVDSVPNEIASAPRLLAYESQLRLKKRDTSVTLPVGTSFVIAMLIL